MVKAAADMGIDDHRLSSKIYCHHVVRRLLWLPFDHPNNLCHVIDESMQNQFIHVLRCVVCLCCCPLLSVNWYSHDSIALRHSSFPISLISKLSDGGDNLCRTMNCIRHSHQLANRSFYCLKSFRYLLIGLTVMSCENVSVFCSRTKTLPIAQIASHEKSVFFFSFCFFSPFGIRVTFTAYSRYVTFIHNSHVN